MPDVWYSTVGSGTRLTQGDLISDCPLVGWKEDVTSFEGAGETEVLKQSVDAFKADTVVMTQACDLEHARQCAKPARPYPRRAMPGEES